MHFDFDTIIDRHNTFSLKWDMGAREHELPMWVADMDFATAPAIVEALHNRVDHGIFGYSLPSNTFYSAIIDWWSSRHQFNFSKENIIPTTGILPALVGIINAISTAQAKVLVLSPVYDHFFSAIDNTGRKAISSELNYQDNKYTIDLVDLEGKLSAADVEVLLLSNPHNPTGRVWNKTELEAIGELCLKYNVKVISDEIHADLVYAPYKHIAFASINPAFEKICITCSSPSKSFNLAGMQVGYVIITDQKIREAVSASFMKMEMFLISPLANEALVAAYTKSNEWLNQLIAYLKSNYELSSNFISDKLPKLSYPTLEGTYLLWLDCNAYSNDSDKLDEHLRATSSLRLNKGNIYGKGGEGFMRMNIACPKSMLNEGLTKLKQGLDLFNI